MQFGLKTVLVVVALVALLLFGYLRWNRNLNTWVVQDYSGGKCQILHYKHCVSLETGEPEKECTYGVEIRNRERSCYVLWADGDNPFQLEPGNRILLRKSFWKQRYDGSWKGYYAKENDIIHVDKTK